LRIWRKILGDQQLLDRGQPDEGIAEFFFGPVVEEVTHAAEHLA
jgi:hypothetical protein